MPNYNDFNLDLQTNIEKNSAKDELKNQLQLRRTASIDRTCPNSECRCW